MRVRGATLAETLVAGTLVILLVGVFTSVFILTAKLWRSAENWQTAQREALTLTHRIQQDYRSSLCGSLSLERTPQSTTFSFLSYQAALNQASMWSPEGQILWRKWVQYRHSNRKVDRREVALPQPTVEPAPGIPAWPADQPSTTLASHITTWRVEEANADSPILRIHLVVQVESRAFHSRIMVMPILYQSDAL